jgi:hypothetical protein
MFPFVPEYNILNYSFDINGNQIIFYDLLNYALSKLYCKIWYRIVLWSVNNVFGEDLKGNGRRIMLSLVTWLDAGFGLVPGFIGLLKHVITKNYSSLAISDNLQFTMAPTKSSVFSPCVAWHRIPIFSSASVLTSMPAGYHHTTGPQLAMTNSELLYVWLFSSNQFVLEPNPLRLTTRVFILCLCNWTLAAILFV